MTDIGLIMMPLAGPLEINITVSDSEWHDWFSNTGLLTLLVQWPKKSTEAFKSIPILQCCEVAIIAKLHCSINAVSCYVAQCVLSDLIGMPTSLLASSPHHHHHQHHYISSITSSIILTISSSITNITPSRAPSIQDWASTSYRYLHQCTLHQCKDEEGRGCCCRLYMAGCQQS